ncbi:beta-glucosidase [Sphingomonas ginkgonis]|uniref:Beta-glucosidase n=1 Tax=Sphingomonas ginkgonis TaxID=2315330 RepID=A0A3R9WQ40_9SPHN|nr:glycoside hydrolase family 3 C-terminal domain-containing protein [Sphingomonas ginkgonis]RST30666.1 beta-glucosidase [Sphingomonas ginkgonis]
MTDPALSHAEQAALTAGAAMWETVAVPHAGVPSVRLADGPMGIASGRVDERDVALLTPCPTALGASWDVDLVRRVGALVGHEAVRMSVDLVLAPNLNLPRSPLVGRSFELFSEDPFLTGSLGVAWLQGMQSTGTGAVAKHLVCNDSETQRNSMNVRIGERPLREVYLLPFEMAAEAGAAGLLTAYNRVNGLYCAEHAPILSEIVRADWRFEGLLVSDWFGTMSSDSLAAGLSLEMPGPGRFMGDRLIDADPALVAAAASHVARTAVRWSAAKAVPIDPADAEALLVEAAAAGFTLLRNEGGLLPLVPGRERRIAVIGPNATSPCFQGGTFARIALTPYAVNPLDALRARFAGIAEVVHEPGVDPSPRLPPMNVTPARDLGDGCTRGMTIDYFADHALSGEPLASETRATNSLTWFTGMHELGAWDCDGAVRASGLFNPTRSGEHDLRVGGTGAVRLLVDGREVLCHDQQIAPGDIMGVLKAGDSEGVAVRLEAGRPVSIRVEFRYGKARAQGLWFGIREPDEPEAMLARAVAAARSADAVLLVIGETSDSGVESKDRADTAIDPPQQRLIERVCAANPRTAIIANVGHAFDTSWEEQAAAMILAWYPGQGFGPALAAVVAGDREPGGRMPVTIARRDEDYPAFDTTPNGAGNLAYDEGVRIGYRGMPHPRHALGAGFGYARFAIAAAAVAPTPEGWVVELDVENVSAHAGSEVVQVYRAEPEITLIGFAKVHLAPGERQRIAIPLARRRMMIWDGGWQLLGKRATLLVGRSAVDTPFRLDLPLA